MADMKVYVSIVYLVWLSATLAEFDLFHSRNFPRSLYRRAILRAVLSTRLTIRPLPLISSLPFNERIWCSIIKKAPVGASRIYSLNI